MDVQDYDDERDPEEGEPGVAARMEADIGPGRGCGAPAANVSRAPTT